MERIRDFTGKIIKILDVIDGTTINDEMIQNILAIYFTPKLKKELSLLLNKYNTIFDPRQINVQSLKPGTVILGPYSSGKSHFALFLAFLFGLNVNFVDTNLREETPNIREKCWEIIEKEEVLDYKVIELKDLRNEKYLVSFVTLTNFREQSNFLSIIVDAVNRSLESYGINKMIGIELTEKNRTFILDHMISKDPSAYNEYSIISDEEEGFIFLKNYANKYDLRLKLKSNKEIASELQLIARENGYRGYLLFFDEFFRYYNPQVDNSKIKIGSILQSFAYEIQNDVKLGILPISQEPIFENDVFLQQVERRFSKVSISYENATSIIHKRLIPEVNLNAIECFYRDRFFSFPDTSSSRKRITLDVFKDYYPFHKKTVNDLQKFVGYYANDTKGVINYIWYALNSYASKDADHLITADTLYDYFISGLNSPDMRGYEQKEKFEEINEQYISRIESSDERELSAKILKILLFCTNRSMDWSLNDFYNHFYDFSEIMIKKILENLIQYIENHSNFISANISRENFYYNPGGRGDINRYVTIIERAINEDRVLDFYWNESMSDRLQGQSQKKEIFKWKKVLCKTYSIIQVKENLERTVDESLKLLTNLPEKEDIFGYEFDPNLISDAVFIIDNQNSSFNKSQIHSLIHSKIKEVKMNLNLPNFDFSLYYVKPKTFSKTETQKIKNYYARKICATLFELISTKKDYTWNELKDSGSLRRYNAFLNDTVMDMNLKQFSGENKDTLLRYITDIKVTLSPVEEGSIRDFLRDDNINSVFVKSLNNAEIFDTKNFSDYSNSIHDFDAIIKETIEILIPLKYSVLDDLIVMDTKKLYDKYLTGVLNLLLRNVFIDSYEFRITDSKTEQVLKTTFHELDLIENIRENDFRFNERFSLENSRYFKRFNELFRGKSKVEINEILLEYLKPPYGFPKIVTFLMLLSLVHMQKFIFIWRDNEISSLTDIKNIIGINTINKNGVNELIRRGYIAKGDTLNLQEFDKIKSIISTLINYEVYKTYKIMQDGTMIVDFNSESLKKFIDDIIGINAPSLNHQNQLVELIDSLQVTKTLSSLKSTILGFHEQLNNYYKKHSNTQFTTFDYEKFGLYVDLYNLSEFLNQIQEIESSGKRALTEFIKIFDEWFNLNDFKKALAEIFSVIEIVEEKTSDINLISEGLVFLNKTSFIQEEDWIKNQHQEIITDIREVLANSNEFMIIIKGSPESLIKIKDPLEKYKKIFITQFKQLHSKVWNSISVFQDKFESDENVLIKVLENLTNLKIKTSYGQKEIKHQISICNLHGNLDDKKIIEDIGCSECETTFYSDFNLNIIPGCGYSLNTSKLMGAESDDIINEIYSKLNEFLITQILKIFEFFKFEEDDETLGSNIIKKLSYELNQEDRKEFLESIKSSKVFNYSKAREIFIYKSTADSERKSLVFLALEFLYRVGLTLENPQNINFISNQVSAINFILEKRGFALFFNNLIETNLSSLDQIKINYEIFQLEDLLNLDFQSGINDTAKKQIQELYKKNIKEYGKILIVPYNKSEFIGDIYFDIEKNNLNLRIMRLNSLADETPIEKIEKSILKKENSCFSAYEQISIMDQKLQNDLQTLIRNMFSNNYYFGDLDGAREFFNNNPITYLEIFIIRNNKWEKWGYIQEIFGCIEEFKEIKGFKNG